MNIKMHRKLDELNKDDIFILSSRELEASSNRSNSSSKTFDRRAQNDYFQQLDRLKEPIRLDNSASNWTSRNKKHKHLKSNSFDYPDDKIKSHIFRMQVAKGLKKKDPFYENMPPNKKHLLNLDQSDNDYIETLPSIQQSSTSLHES